MTQTVAITGASAGIGRAAARLFAQRGDRVGSALGARGIPLQAAYCGGKHAING